jgi:hypothetical protein
VYAAFREGRATPFRTDSRFEQANHSRYFTPPPPTHEVGEEVTVTGWVNILVSPDGQTTRATLRDPVIPAQYILVGETVAEMAEVMTVQTSVQVTGRVVAQDGPGRWQVAVDEWQAEIISSFGPPHCLIGTFEAADDQGWLRLDEAENGRYAIHQPPAELTSGERIEICLRAEEDMAAGELNWLHIASPPYSESQPASSSMTMAPVGIVTESVTAVEADGRQSTTVTQHVVELDTVHVEAPYPVVPTAPPVLVPGGMEGVAAPILPESPYELGQSVVITGIVQGHYTADYEGQINRIEVTLLVDDQDTPLRLGFPVLADDALLDELLTDHYWRFVTLSGTMVKSPSDRWGTSNQAIELESYRPVWPEAVARNFLGHTSLEHFDGTEALVFTDKETGQQYILSWDIRADDYAYREAGAQQQQLLRGLVHPTRELAGLPFMYQIGSRFGVDIETADQFPLEIEAPVHRLAPDYVTRPGQADIVVERMELVYHFEPHFASRDHGQPPQLSEEQIARPVWLIVAHSADGLMQMRYYLEASP